MPVIGEIKRDSGYRKSVWIDCPNCGKERWVRLERSPASQRCNQCRLNPLRYSYNAGPNSPRWKGGKTRDADGYIKVYAPWHPKADHNYVFEHRLVAETKLGRLLKPNEICHHINAVITDNRPENIEVCNGRGEHGKKHNKVQAMNLARSLLKD